MQKFVRYFDCYTEGGKTRIVVSSRPRYIFGRDGWIDFEEEYGAVLRGEVDDPQKRQEAQDLLRYFGTEERLIGEVIFEGEVDLDKIDVFGRCETIRQAEIEAGLNPDLLREIVWVEGAENTPGVIILPQDDYARVYVLKGSRDNPQVVWVPEKQEANGVRPYYEKRDGRTYIYVDGFSGGAGTQEDPYLIHDVYELQAIKNNLNAHYALAQDIDASETVNWNDGAGFEPIGKNTAKFAGSFDGRGHRIIGLYINRPDMDFVGLFGVAQDATVRNVGIVDGNITGRNYVGAVVGSAAYVTVSQCYNTGLVSGAHSVGGVVGYVNSCSVTQCYNTGSVFGVNDVGGVVGQAYSTTQTTTQTTTQISQCYNTGSISGRLNVGGVVGFGYDSGSTSSRVIVTKCYNAGPVTSVTNAGGVVGYPFYSTVTECYNTAPVRGETYVGGVAGYVNSGTITQCYNTGSVEGTGTHVGGVVGYSHISSQIRQCYNTGSVSGNDYVGGVVGYTYYTTVNQCYNAGSVSGADGVGGVIGYQTNTTITICYWDTQTSGRSNGISAGPETGMFGKTTAEMQSQATFLGWDFRNIWGIIEGVTYPFLRSIVGPIEHNAEGSGTQADPYVIRNVYQLQNMRNDPSAHYALGRDIDASETRTWNGGAGFVPIGSTSDPSYQPFSGSFDGRNFTITHLFINRGDLVGLFGEVDGSPGGVIVKNLKLKAIDITGNFCVGAIAGRAASSVVIENCHVEGRVQASRTVGGLVGELVSGSRVSKSSFRGEVVATDTSNADCGGLVGRNSESIVDSCFSGAIVSGVKSIGGFVALHQSGTISNCYCHGKVEAKATDFVGGFVGTNQAAIVNCYTVTKVSPSSGASVGGFAGSNSGSLQGCYWDTQMSGQLQGVGYGDPTGATGKTTAEMKQQATFAGWDFASVWDIVEGKTYPFLRELVEVVGTNPFPFPTNGNPKHSNPKYSKTRIAVLTGV